MLPGAIKEPEGLADLSGSVIRVNGAKTHHSALPPFLQIPHLPNLLTKTGSATSSSAVAVSNRRQRATIPASGESCGRPRDRATGMAVLDSVSDIPSVKLPAFTPSVGSELRQDGRGD